MKPSSASKYPLGLYKQAKTPEEYLSQRVCRDTTTGCLNWIKGVDKDGYGQCQASLVARQSKVTRAHQLAYVAANGLIPSGMLVCHSCDNPACCEPSHLFLGTVQDNNADKLLKGRQRAPSGMESTMSKLTYHDVAAIKALRGVVASTIVGPVFGVTYSNVCIIWRGEGWRRCAA